jgi:microcystin-dependent protein
MKRLLLSLVCLASSFAAFSQANVTSTAISVQGIARNSSNNAVANSSISISAELYYINSSNTAVNILTRTGTVNTDAFGVFAYVVDISSSDFIKITNSEAWIKISSGGVTFAQEKLMAVPYALHAQNGAPTGSIMPYVGSSAPAGWLLCDGSAIPSGDAYAALKTILGNATNVPDLRGMFIRGAGSQTVNSVSVGGNTLRSVQGDATKNHTHSFTSSSATTSTNGSHTHDIFIDRSAYQLLSGLPIGLTNNSGDDGYNSNGSFIKAAGDHAHTVTVTGTTDNPSGGQTETRPVNYGVNYIIKI